MSNDNDVRDLNLGNVKVRPNQLSHIAMITNDLAKMRNWYLTVLEATVAYEDATFCFATFDEEHHRIAIIGLGNLGAAPPGIASVNHVAFTYGSLRQLLYTYTRLKQKDILPFWTINHGPTTSFYYKDPDGNKVELLVDNFATVAEVDAFFAAGNYVENPVGIVFDPEILIQRFESGESMESLRARPKLPEGMTPWDMVRQ